MSTQTSNYREVKAISNSVLAEYEKEHGLKEFKNFWLYSKPFEGRETDYFRLGSLVDTLLTRTKEEQDQMIYISDAEEPTPQMKKFYKNLLDIWNADNSDAENNIRLAYEKTGFGRDSLDSVKKKFDTKYFNDQLRGKNKIVCSQKFYDWASILASKLLTNEFTKDILSIKTDALLKVEVFNQLELYDNYEYIEFDEIEDNVAEQLNKKSIFIPVKGALDRVIVDHITKQITIIDFKTSNKLNAWWESYIEYKYFRQASYYRWLVVKWAEKNGWENYRITPFRFLVISTTGEGAYSYIVSNTDIAAAEYGGETYNKTIIKGWRELLDEIGWHIMHNKWEYPKKVYESNGTIPMNMLIM